MAKGKNGGRRGRGKRGRSGLWHPEWSVKKKLRRARGLPVYECCINASWRETGLAHILLARQQPDDRILFAVYLVDTECLGLKDTFCNADLPLSEYEGELRASMDDVEDIIPCPLELAHTIVYGGIDYAKELGFRPHADFRLSRHVLEQKSALPFRDDVEFGRDGKPFYVAGADDDVEFILEQLRLNVGKGGFEYMVPMEAMGLDPDEWEEMVEVDGEELYLLPAGALEELCALPRREEEVWEGGIVRFDTWVQEGDGEPFHPALAVWTTRDGRLAHASALARPEKVGFAMALSVLGEMAADPELGGYKPGTVAVSDPELADYLSGMLEGPGITVTCRDDLPALAEVLEDLEREALGGPSGPGVLEGEGMTVERLRAFAEAARVCYEAAPWEELSNDDLIEVRGPDAPPGMSHVVVLGKGGMVRGIGFYASEENFWDRYAALVSGQPTTERAGEVWMLTYGTIYELPVADAELWQEHDLPVAGEDAYPVLLCAAPDDSYSRADAETTAFAEGLLRALAATESPEIDAGEWAKEVATFDGPITYELVLPLLERESVDGELFRRGALPDRRAMERTLAHLGEAMEALPAGEAACEPADREALREAQELCYDAFECRGRRRVKLARRALEVCPDCADAYVLLAEDAADLEERLDLYRKGVEAGRRALGERAFREDVGYFWGLISTRPFMRALHGLAESLEDCGRREEAAEHYRELLRLNPDDNQGVRYCLLPLLIALDRDQEARELLEKYRDDVGAVWLYCGALLAFREEGNTPRSRRLLREAQEFNSNVPDFLLGDADLPALPSYYSPGSRAEAAICADLIADAWEHTPGALDWLERRRRAA